jgi:hypothetical protein
MISADVVRWLNTRQYSVPAFNATISCRTRALIRVTDGAENSDIVCRPSIHNPDSVLLDGADAVAKETIRLMTANNGRPALSPNQPPAVIRPPGWRRPR